MKNQVYIGTARNIDAEVGMGTGQPEHKFIIVHLCDNEPVGLEGFKTKEEALAALKEYYGADIEYLFTELEY